MHELVHRYLACWNETDPAARRALIAEVFTADATYVDPLAEVQGHAGIEAAVAGVQQQFPGFVFTLLGAPDTHHSQARFTWSFGPDGATEPRVVGFVVVTVDGDGRIATVLGFLDRVPS